jgi:hypothetical protein
VVYGLFGSTEVEGRCEEGFLRRGKVKHNLLDKIILTFLLKF